MKKIFVLKKNKLIVAIQEFDKVPNVFDFSYAYVNLRSKNKYQVVEIKM